MRVIRSVVRVLLGAACLTAASVGAQVPAGVVEADALVGDVEGEVQPLAVVLDVPFDGEIARGGMGAILKGRDTDLGRDLAIKVLLERYKDRPEVVRHKTAARPWGSYVSVDSGPRYQVKHITVKPGGRLSLQYHHHRSEHWLVIEGEGEVEIDEQMISIKQRSHIHIPLKSVHRVKNTGLRTLIILELQQGDVLFTVGSKLGEMICDLVGKTQQSALVQQPQRGGDQDLGVRVQQPKGVGPRGLGLGIWATASASTGLAKTHVQHQVTLIPQGNLGPRISPLGDVLLDQVEQGLQGPLSQRGVAQRSNRHGTRHLSPRLSS